MHRLRVRASARLVRAFSTISEKIEERPVKSWAEILTNAQERTFSDRKSLDSKSERNSVSHNRLEWAALKARIRPGDFIMVSTTVLAVLKLPDSFDLPILACDAKGVTHEIALPMITARLGTLVDENSQVLQGCLSSDNSAVSVEFYQHVGYALGSLQNDALALARTLAPVVSDLVLLCQKDSKAVTASLYDFLRMVQLYEHTASDLESVDFPLPISSHKAALSPVFILAMRMVLDHHLVRDKIRLEFGLSKKDFVVIKSRAQERLHIQAAAHKVDVTGSTKVPALYRDYVKDYALDNLSTTNPFSEGTAVQIIRNVDLPFKDDNPITQTTALSWAHSFGALHKLGPFMDRTAYQWLLEPNRNEHLAEVAEQGFDRLEGKRSSVEEVVYCIDSSDTTEVDDGISVRQQGQNTVLSVHISNPSSAFKDPMELIEAVRKRPTTIYMPHERRNMLPRAFADKFSLAKDNRALTVDMTFQQSGALLRTDVRATTLKYVSRLDYGAVQQLLEEGSQKDLGLMFELANAFRAKRRANHAITDMVLQSNMQPKAKDHKVTLEYLGADAAQLLVSECMLQANSAIANYCYKNDVPCIFRSNDFFFHTEKQAAEFRKQSVVGFEWLSALRSSTESTTPAPHRVAGLGLYTFSTSPLRRAQDILLHLQLEAHLLGEQPPLSKAELDNMIPWISTSQNIVKSFQKQTDRFWILKWLEEHQDSLEPTKAIYAECVSPNLHRVWVPDYKVFAELKSAKSFEVTRSFKCRITRVSAMIDQLQVEEAPDCKL